jgi:predicted secreted protein
VRIAERMIPLARSQKVDRYIDEAITQLGQTEAMAYERGLLRLGELLGYDAVRPAASASPDGAWRDGDDQILWEAKSEQEEEGQISARLVREANTHPTWVQRELDWAADANVVTFLVSPRTEAISTAADHVELCTPAAAAGVAVDAADLWRSVLGRIAGLTPTEVPQLVAGELASRGLHTADPSARLQARRIADLDSEH